MSIFQKGDPIFKKMPSCCQECLFGGMGTCWYDGSGFPEEEMLDPNYKGRYSNCKLKKDEITEAKIIFYEVKERGPTQNRENKSNK